MLLRCAENILKMLMRSPVMERSLGRISDEEKEAAENALPEEQVNFDLEYYKVDEYLELPGGRSVRIGENHGRLGSLSAIRAYTALH